MNNLSEKCEVDEINVKNEEIKEEIKEEILENVVLGLTSITTENNGCVSILKSGPNKGSPCGNKIVSENLCKKHLKN